MAICPSCAAALPTAAHFCPACGVAQVDGGTREVRKVVTILFCDVADSTVLGETRDPEVVRSVMATYYETMRAVVELHGGTVEKFIGDAIVALFGIPVAREDDAFRAVSAAAGMQAAVHSLNATLSERHAVTLAIRIGITTGEVVAGESLAGGTYATGDAVNTAARLQAASASGETLLDASTVALAASRVVTEAVQPLSVRGKAQAVAAYRLVRLRSVDARTARPVAPMLGRDAELARLLAAVKRAHAKRRPDLVTVVGGAGVGKSRLVREALASLGPAVGVYVGRCLPYGEGITWWPMREIVHAAAGIVEGDVTAAAWRKLTRLVEQLGIDRRVSGLVGAAIGLTPEVGVRDEVFWAMQVLCGSLGQRRPSVLVFEDLHWAEESLLDFLEHVRGGATGSAIVVLATARPELLESHPAWGLETHGSLVRVDVLDARDCAALVAAQPGGAALPAGLVGRIAVAAEGNPLYVEEMVGMLRDEGRLRDTGERGWSLAAEPGAIVAPPTIRALLAARLDALPAVEREVVRRASVIGPSFEVAAAAALCEEGFPADLVRTLDLLARREILRSDAGETGLAGAYRFRHALIRDAAYETLAKADRASLHERHADWLLEVSGDRVEEYEHILGYHLGEAHRYLCELGPGGPRAAGLADRAAGHLLRAGRRAAWSGDTGAAVTLLEQAWALAVDVRTRFEVGHDLAMTMFWADDYARARALADQLADLATQVADASLRLTVAVLQALLDMFNPPDGKPVDLDRTESFARDAAAGLAAAGDARGAAHAQSLLAQSQYALGRVDESSTSWATAGTLAAQFGDVALAARLRVMALGDIQWGASHLDDGLARLQEAMAGLDHQPIAHAVCLAVAGQHLAWLGRHREARRSWDEGLALFRATGERYWDVPLAAVVAELALAGEHPGFAEEDLRAATETAQRLEAASEAATSLGYLSRVLVAVGRLDEAETASEEAWALAPRASVWARWVSGIAAARIRLLQGRHLEALEVALSTLGLARTVDVPVIEGDAGLEVALAARALDREHEAEHAFEQALVCYRRKGAVALIERAQRTWGGRPSGSAVMVARPKGRRANAR